MLEAGVNIWKGEGELWVGGGEGHAQGRKAGCLGGGQKTMPPQ